jgi:hypothetical protein
MLQQLNLKILLYTSITFMFTVLYCENGISQIINLNEMPRYYDRTARIKKPKDWVNMRDVFHSEKFLMGRRIFSGNISYNTGRVILNDGKGNLHSVTREALGFFTRIAIIEEFSLNTTFYKNFNPLANQQWISDFTYSLGRYNWRPKTVNFGYENYINNRYSDGLEVLTQKFLQGYYFLSVGHNLPDKLMSFIRIDSTSNIRFNYFIRHAFRYKDQYEQIHAGSGRTSMGASANYMIFRSIYVEGAVYYYFNSEKVKQPWDPDFSYGFGYFDYRPFRFSLTYGNWVINRFPWSAPSPYTYYGLLDGNLRLIFNYSW